MLVNPHVTDVCQERHVQYGILFDEAHNQKTLHTLHTLYLYTLRGVTALTNCRIAAAHRQLLCHVSESATGNLLLVLKACQTFALTRS